MRTRCYLCDSDRLEEITSELRYGPGAVWRCATCSLGMLTDSPGAWLPGCHRYHLRLSTPNPIPVNAGIKTLITYSL